MITVLPQRLLKRYVFQTILHQTCRAYFPPDAKKRNNSFYERWLVTSLISVKVINIRQHSKHLFLLSPSHIPLKHWAGWVLQLTVSEIEQVLIETHNANLTSSLQGEQAFPMPMSIQTAIGKEEGTDLTIFSPLESTPRSFFLSEVLQDSQPAVTLSIQLLIPGHSSHC